jgi:hypothetical protein
MPSGEIRFPVRDAQGNVTRAALPLTVAEPDPGGVDQTVAGDQPAGFTVPAGETWEVLGLVTTPANVVVRGTLRMRPGATLRFRNVSEAAFQGGDTPTPLASDVGLWMVDQGRLDAQGTPKTPWTRLDPGSDAPLAGATVLTVQDAAGWKVGDEIVVTATVDRSVSSFWTRDDRRAITAVSGNTVTVAALANAHPARTIPATPTGDAETLTAEVLNLTRDVRIEGTPGGRAHVVYLHQGHTVFPQVGIRYVELAHLAPAKSGAGVAGRYALHYHHSHGTTEDVVVEGVVARECGGHCFVAHQADGVHFDRCVSHNTSETPFWWDPEQVSDRVVYDRCVASRVSCFTGPERFSTSGFFLNKTSVPLASRCVGCVATGIDSSSDPNGYFWNNASVGVWTFEDCLAHNVRDQGIRVWQNSNEQMHPLDRFRAYTCGRGVDHGAYSNSYRYHDLKIHDCGLGIVQRAMSHEGGQQWHDVFVTACPTTLEIGDAPVSSITPIDFRRSPFGTVRVNAAHAGVEQAWWDFTDCGLEPGDFTIVAMAGPCRIRTQDGGAAWQRTESGGWTQISPF